MQWEIADLSAFELEALLPPLQPLSLDSISPGCTSSYGPCGVHSLGRLVPKLQAGLISIAVP
jgi:hypothetical protein